MPSLDWYFRIKNPILHALRPTSQVLSFTMRQIREHESYPDAARPDFLTRFLQARDKNPDFIDEEGVRDYTNANMTAASDTTAVMLRTLIYELLNNPAIYARFMEELKAILKVRNDDERNDKPITWAESLKMTYFQVCVKEALRYNPAACQILPRIVPEGGVELCGKYLPSGTVVGCNAWTLHRDKELYGSDADTFRPERWLDSTPEQVRKMDSLLFTFGAGSRSCVGKNIAMLEMCKFIPELFRRFEMHLVDPNRYKIQSTWLIYQSGLDVKMRWRDSGSFLD
jgi:cytochrome P450